MKNLFPTIRKTGGIFCAICLVFSLRPLADNAQGQDLHSGDIELQVAGGQIVTNRQIYAAELGEIIPNEVDEPGFDSSAGTFSSGSKIRFSLLDSLREWNGADFETIAEETISMSFGRSLGPVTTPQQPGVVAGFELPTSSDGAWHRHYDFVLSAPASTGIYLLQLELSSSDSLVGATDPFFIVFNQNDTQLNHDAAIEYAELQIDTGMPGDFNQDDFVDAADYTLWQDNRGLDIAMLGGNASPGPVVSNADYALWKQFFQTLETENLSTHSVPEPNSLLTALTGLLLLATGHPQGRSRRRMMMMIT